MPKSLLVFSLFSAFLCGEALQAGLLTGSASVSAYCRVEGDPDVVGVFELEETDARSVSSAAGGASAACSIVPGISQTEARAIADLSFGAEDNAVLIDADVDGLSVGDYPWPEARHQIDISFDFLGKTAGPKRPGIVRYYVGEYPLGQGGATGGISMDAAIDDLVFDYFLATGPSTCFAGEVGDLGACMGERSFELGGFFDLTATVVAGGIGTFRGSEDSKAPLRLSFEFFEADGVTPANLEPVPEPSTALLLLAGLGLAGFLGRRRS